jgi:hypothetical protein
VPGAFDLVLFMLNFLAVLCFGFGTWLSTVRIVVADLVDPEDFSKTFAEFLSVNDVSAMLLIVSLEYLFEIW